VSHLGAETDRGVDLLRHLVVFDLETTGLSPENDEIIQIAALRIVGGRLRSADSFSSYVRPARPVSPFITNLTGITQRDVAAAPRIAEVLPGFSAFCGDALLAAHNGHTFDVPFLRRACRGRSAGLRQVPYIDSMHLSWQVWGRGRGLSHGLDSVIARLGVATAGVRRHDARGDVDLLARCVLDLVARASRLRRLASLSVYNCHLPAALPPAGGDHGA
jgi:DNA polymerase III epsilon subunit family exonuclease